MQLIAPTQLWVIMERDRGGFPRGFHKTTGEIFYDESSAINALRYSTMKETHFQVVPFVAVSLPEYSQLTKSYEEQE